VGAPVLGRDGIAGAPARHRRAGVLPGLGAQARDALASRVLHQPVTVQERGRDDYGRTLARLHWNGMDVGGWLVFSGLAWSSGFKRRAGPYDDLQRQARDARRGLWSELQPVRRAPSASSTAAACTKTR
jgi:endonuclease YncB( thermonuclease family)